MSETMKLSQAIREGAKLAPQAFGDYFDWVGGVQAFGTCALGAACQVLLHMDPNEDHIGASFNSMVIREHYPDLPENILDEIIDRNDTKKESRESIADWLESIGH